MKKIWWLVIISLLLAAGALIYLACYTSKDAVYFFAVGQGDAALIRTRTGLKVLVDCGPNRVILNKLGRVLPFFDRTIDYLIITHPDLDHYGGCLAVLQNYQIGHIVVNGEEKKDDYAARWAEAKRYEGAEVTVIDGFSRWRAGEIDFDFLAPGREWGNYFGNDQSIVFLLSHPRIKILFTGDMGIAEEEALLRRYCEGMTTSSCPRLRANILKVGHHGSDTSSSEEFLRAVMPEKALISVGPNSFGHPTARVLNRLERVGAKILRLDEEGDIIIELESL